MRHSIVRQWTHIARIAVISLMILVVFQSSGLGSGPLGLLGVAHAASLKPQPPTDSQDAGRFIPYINAPQSPVGSWTPQKPTGPRPQNPSPAGKNGAGNRS